MQIPPLANNIAASASASNSQSRANASEKAGQATTSTSVQTNEQVGKGEQTQDRDANEQYMAGGENKQHENSERDKPTTVSSPLNLEVYDPNPSQLDLRG